MPKRKLIGGALERRPWLKPNSSPPSRRAQVDAAFHARETTQAGRRVLNWDHLRTVRVPS